MDTKQRKAKNGVVDKHHIMDGNAIPRPRENCSRSGVMEDHDSQPSHCRRHLMMMMMMMMSRYSLGIINAAYQMHLCGNVFVLFLDCNSLFES